MNRAPHSCRRDYPTSYAALLSSPPSFPETGFHNSDEGSVCAQTVMLENVETTGRDADSIPGSRPQTSCPYPWPSSPLCPEPHGSTAASLRSQSGVARCKLSRGKAAMASTGRLVITQSRISTYFRNVFLIQKEDTERDKCASLCSNSTVAPSICKNKLPAIHYTVQDPV